MQTDKRFYTNKKNKTTSVEPLEENEQIERAKSVILEQIEAKDKQIKQLLFSYKLQKGFNKMIFMRKIVFILIICILITGCIQKEKTAEKPIEIAHLSILKTQEIPQMLNESVRKELEGKIKEGWFLGTVKIRIENHLDEKRNITLILSGRHESGTWYKSMRFSTSTTEEIKLFEEILTREFSLEPKSKKTIEPEYLAFYTGNYTIKITLKTYNETIDEKEIKTSVGV